MDRTYREDIQVDKYEVVELWETHTDRFIKWGENYVDASRERDKAKELADYEKSLLKDDLEFVKAELGIEYKNNYKQYGLSKPPSDKVVEMYVIANSKYQDALDKFRYQSHEFNSKLLEAEHKVSTLKLAKEAFEQRSKALDGLTKLLVGGFYQARLPKILEEEVLENRNKLINERAREDTQETIKRRRRKEQVNG